MRERATKIAAWLCIFALAAVATAGANPYGGLTASAQQGETRIGIDATADGNGATSLATIDSCTSVDKGDTIDVDLFVINVTDLLAWEIYVNYDPSIVQVVDRDVELFQGSGDNAVFDASERVPDDDGRYRVAAANISDQPVGTSGTGVLARVTVKAVHDGVTTLSVAPVDIFPEPPLDLGPTLTDVAGNRIGDSNGDSFFDGETADASIAVGADCEEITSTPVGTAQPSATAGPSDGSPADADGDDGFPWWVLGPIIGGVIAAVLAGGLALRMRGRGGGYGGAGPGTDI